MVATDKLFAGSIPELYDRFMVPLMFEELCPRSRGPAGEQPGHRICWKTAAGTGVLTRAGRRAASGVHADHRDEVVRSGRYCEAQGKGQPSPAARRIASKRGRRSCAAFGDRSFDAAVACSVRRDVFPDRVAGYRGGAARAEESRRPLRSWCVADRISEKSFCRAPSPRHWRKCFRIDPPSLHGAEPRMAIVERR